MPVLVFCYLFYLNFLDIYLELLILCAHKE